MAHMEHKYTPGPWRFYAEPQPNGCPIVGTGGLMVAQLAHSINYPEQRDTAIANARLIASAPELLEALIAVDDFIRGKPEAVEPFGIVRAAIAKATGD